MPKFRGLKPYHLAWLLAHPDRDWEWLFFQLKEGFQVHHIDGDHGNDDPGNLMLVYAADHIAIHGHDLRAKLKRRWHKPMVYFGRGGHTKRGHRGGTKYRPRAVG